jgi:hypothetical protein
MSRKSGRAKGVVCGLLLRCDRAERCDLTCSFREGGNTILYSATGCGEWNLGGCGGEGEGGERDVAGELHLGLWRVQLHTLGRSGILSAQLFQELDEATGGCRFAPSAVAGCRWLSQGVHPSLKLLQGRFLSHGSDPGPDCIADSAASLELFGSALVSSPFLAMLSLEHVHLCHLVPRVL